MSNLGERTLHDEIIGAVAEYRATIYRKVRVADVVDISKLSSHQLGSYALKAHFDICVADENHVPAFAIEYDGGGHDPKHDAKKDTIAAEADLALFRVDERLLGRGPERMTFLQYLVHTWFLGNEFLRMQSAGEIAYDEPFMMSGFLKPDAKHIFDSEFDFLGRPRGRLNRLMRQAGSEFPNLAHLNMSMVVLGRGDSSFVAFASAPMGSAFAYGKARIDVGTPSLSTLEELPFGWSALSDFCEGLAAEDLCDQIEMKLGTGGHVTLNAHEVYSHIDELRAQGFRSLRGASGKEPELIQRAMS